jgi:hypothetical protein
MQVDGVRGHGYAGGNSDSPAVKDEKEVGFDDQPAPILGNDKREMSSRERDDDARMRFALMSL